MATSQSAAPAPVINSLVHDLINNAGSLSANLGSSYVTVQLYNADIEIGKDIRAAMKDFLTRAAAAL